MRLKMKMKTLIIDDEILKKETNERIETFFKINRIPPEYLYLKPVSIGLTKMKVANAASTIHLLYQKSKPKGEK